MRRSINFADSKLHRSLNERDYVAIHENLFPPIEIRLRYYSYIQTDSRDNLVYYIPKRKEFGVLLVSERLRSLPCSGGYYRLDFSYFEDSCADSIEWTRFLIILNDKFIDGIIN